MSTPTLTRRDNYAINPKNKWCWTADEGCRFWYVCGRKLLLFFDIPSDTEYIVLTAYDKPTTHSVDIEIIKIKYKEEEPYYTFTSSRLDQDDTVNFDAMITNQLIDLFESNNLKKIHVECEYE